MKFKLINPDLAGYYGKYVAEHQEMYPEAMKITDHDIWADEIASTPYSVGMFIDQDSQRNPVGWRIFRREEEDMIYVSDLSILLEYQGQGYAKELVKFSLREPRWYRECIHSFLRRTSYHIVADANLIHEAGYKIVMDRFHKNHYYRRFGLNEDAHELILAPI